MTKTQGSFSLTVEEGEFTDSEIVVMLGENGTGKTTFIRMLHGSLKPDDESIEVPEFRVSYKPQKISPKFPGSVRCRHAPLRDPPVLCAHPILHAVEEGYALHEMRDTLFLLCLVSHLLLHAFSSKRLILHSSELFSDHSKAIGHASCHRVCLALVCSRFPVVLSSTFK